MITNGNNIKDLKIYDLFHFIIDKYVRITKTINGTTSDVVSLATMKSAMQLNNVNNTADANKSVASAATATTLASYRLFDGISFNGSGDVVHFALCDSSSTAISVDCANFQYQAGARIHIYHNQQIGGNSKTLNVENNGAVAIRYKNSPVTPTIPKGTVVEYIYYNNAFHICGYDTDTTYSSMSQSEADGGSSTTGRLISASVLSTTIANAVAGITGISFEVVEQLPATGTAGVIYLVAHSHGTQDIYDEYIWVNSAYEKIGNTDIDLSGYMLKSDMVAITTSEIDTLFS